MGNLDLTETGDCPRIIRDAPGSLGSLASAVSQVPKTGAPSALLRAGFRQPQGHPEFVVGSVW